MDKIEKDLPDMKAGSTETKYPDVGERLKDVFRDENPHNLSKQHGKVSEQSIGRYFKGESWPNQAVQTLVSERNFSLNWVLFGEGSKKVSYLEEPDPKLLAQRAEYLEEFPVEDLAEAIQRKFHKLDSLSSYSVKELSNAIQRKVQTSHRS